MNFKNFLFALFLPVFFTISANAQISDSEITKIIQAHQPSKGCTIPKEINQMIGATHVAGKYYFSTEPFIIEGSKTLSKMGYGVLKLWFNKNGSGYNYNSEWNLPKEITLAELASHPYYKACFDLPFSTFVLTVGGAALKTTDESAAKESLDITELTKYLLTTYKGRNVNFIIQNWEGDWLVRGGSGDGAYWSRKEGIHFQALDAPRVTVKVPVDSLERINAMIKWFNARQRGVIKGREMVEKSKCKVYHAIEGNRIFDSMEGIPGIASSILPAVQTDMVSWSCYEGLDENGIKLYKGIVYLRNQMQPTAYMKGKKIVFLGEIGIPEQRYEDLNEESEVKERWDLYMGVCLAQKIPYVINWQLYCNEPVNQTIRNTNQNCKNNELMGFWLIRPDGTKSWGNEYFEKLLNLSRD